MFLISLYKRQVDFKTKDNFVMKVLKYNVKLSPFFLADISLLLSPAETIHQIQTEFVFSCGAKTCLSLVKCLMFLGLGSKIRQAENLSRNKIL